MPWASSSISRASPSQPGKEKCALPGSRRGPGGAPFSTASGTAARTCAIRSSRSAASRLASSLRRAVASSTATAKARIAGASRVPDRTSRSWPPPCSTGTRSAPLASSSAPTPTGPPILCAVMVSAVAPLPARLDRQLARPPGRRHCGTGSRTRGATAASSATGCTVPTSLLAHITLIRPRPRVALDGLAQRRRARAGRRRRPAASRPRRPRARPATRTLSSTA